MVFGVFDDEDNEEGLLEGLGIGAVTGAVKQRLVKAAALFVGFVSVLLLGNRSLVEPVLSAPGAAWAFLASIPGTIISAILAAPGMVLSAITGLLASWGLGFLATAIAVVAGEPRIALLFVVAVGVGYLNIGGARREVKFIFQLILLAVLGYVSAVTLGEGLIENIPALVVA